MLSAPRQRDYLATVLVHELVHYVQDRNDALQDKAAAAIELPSDRACPIGLLAACFRVRTH